VTTILVLVGSLRAASVNRQLAEVAAESAADGVTLEIYDGLAEVPFYNEDLDTATPPAAAAALRRAATRADGALLITPENNATIPAVLKNAIDWLSRPYGASGLTGTPVAVIGAAAGRHGGAWAHDETRKSVGITGATVLDDVRLSLAIPTLAGRHPREDPAVVAAVSAAVSALADAAAAR